MTELQELASKGIELIRAQREFFKERKPAQLDHCKALERAFYRRCNEILRDDHEPSLFPMED
jgi:hypothetical protein